MSHSENFEFKFGEYRFDKDEKMSELAAKQYYIEFGTEIQASRIMPLVSSWIPDSMLKEKKKPPSKWVNQIVEAHSNSEHVRGRWEPQKVKDNIVHLARFQWSLGRFSIL